MDQTPQSLTELFGRYLRRQMAVHAEGLGLADPDGQVVPHDAVSMQPVDPQLAWHDALAVFGSAQASGVCEAPPDWPSLVAALEPAIDLAFCIGNFPQMLRNLQPFLTGGDLSTLRSHVESGKQRGRPMNVSPALLQWANKKRSYPQLLVAASLLRLARRFEDARELLGPPTKAPAAWQTLRANEEAALAWHRGNAEEALALWHAQKTSVPVLFNRGMAALFLGRIADARIALGQAVAQLPETSAWHHLGHLYLALIAARS